MENTEYCRYGSGRRAIFKFLADNPRHTLASLKSKLCKETEFGNLRQQTIKNYMSEWRKSYSHFGAVPRLHHGLGILATEFDSSLWEAAPRFGWDISRNRNHGRLWRESGISLNWHRNGTVIFRFREFRPNGHLLEAFVHAFREVLLSSGKSELEAINHLHALFKEQYQTWGFHSTYETGQQLPRLVIQDLAKSHGLIIKLGDGSHTTSLEVEQTEPFWLSKIENIVNQLGLEIESHLALIESWREESKENRRTLYEMYKISRQQTKSLTQLTSKLSRFPEQQERQHLSNVDFLNKTSKVRQTKLMDSF